jgi:peroxiredoxin
MVEEGDTAPTFTLPGVVGETADTYQLRVATDDGHAVLLLLFPFDFSPVCTNELCAIRDAEWFQFTPELDVWGISGDSVYAHQAFADEFGLNFPLLSDSHGRVAEAYDVCYEEWENHEAVPQRAVFLVDSDQTIRYAWETEDAFMKPDFFPVKEALDELAAERENFASDEIDFAVEYDNGPGQVEP